MPGTPPCAPSSLIQILEMYKEYIDPEFTWSNFSVEEQAKVIVAPRSNNLLDTARVRAGGRRRGVGGWGGVKQGGAGPGTELGVGTGENG